MTAPIETAAQTLADDLVRAAPVTLASVAVWGHPTLAPTVRAISVTRPLPGATEIGERLARATAPWHRQVIESRQPVVVDVGGARARAPVGPWAGSRRPDPGPFGSVLLLPIRVGHDTLGMVVLGEMRSPEREPFSEAKRRRCVEALDRCLSASAPAWHGQRVDRQRRTTSELADLIRRLSGVRSYQGLLEAVAVGVAQRLGSSTSAVLLRGTRAGGRAEVLAEWRLPCPFEPEEASQLLLAVVRSLGRGDGPVTVTPAPGDPLEPRHGGVAMERVRIGLPLVSGERLLGAIGLYVEEQRQLEGWELDGLWSLAEIAAAWLEMLIATEDATREVRSVRDASWSTVDGQRLLARIQALEEAAARLAEELPVRLQKRAETPGWGQANPAEAWRTMAQAAARESRLVLDGLRDRGWERLPIEVNEAIRRAMILAGPTGDRARFEPAVGPTLVRNAEALAPALAVLLGALSGLPPPGSPITIETRLEADEVLVRVRAGDVREELPRAVRSALAAFRETVTATGARITSVGAEGDLDLRLPVAFPGRTG